jgi:Zn-dependent peptidase ImmA (M78 family)/DNA-binding XRE family transcriptional regulator
MNQVELAAEVGVTRQAISAFELDEKSPDPTTFAALVAALKQPLRYFTEPHAKAESSEGTRFFRKFGADTVRRNDACAVLGEWFVRTAAYVGEYVNLPPVDLPRHEPGDGSRYTFDEVNEIADAVRKSWNLGSGPLSNVLALLESKGVTICRYELSQENVEAFSFWSNGRPFIFIASEKEVGVRSRFDLAHELGHLVLHQSVRQEDLLDKSKLKTVEKEANWFAGAFLLPQATFPNEIYSPRLDSFIPLKARWKVSIQAMIYRCHSLGIFDDEQTLNLRKQISFRKWRTKEPMDNPKTIPLEQPKLLKRAIELLLEHKVKHPEAIVDEVRLRADLLEGFLNLPRGTLSKTDLPGFEPTLR